MILSNQFQLSYSTLFRAACFICSLIIAQTAGASEIPDSLQTDLFNSSAPVSLTLTGPFSLINREKDKSKEYEGTLEYVNTAGETVQLDAKFSARGNWRLDARECRQAQLWVNLKKRQVPGTLFEDQNKLKLVVQCSLGSNYAQWLLKEQLAYEVLGEFTDLKLRSKLVEVSFVNPNLPRKTRPQFAFFIEHHKSVAKAEGMENEKLPTVDLESLDPMQSARVALFANLLGHTDFSFLEGPADESCCHNIKVIYNQEGIRFPLPYDFDNTGWVSADYTAGPSPNIHIGSTSERIYRGLCAHNDLVEPLMAEILGKQSSIESLIARQTELSDRNQKRLLRYTEDWFSTLSQPGAIEENLLEACRY